MPLYRATVTRLWAEALRRPVGLPGMLVFDSLSSRRTFSRATPVSLASRRASRALFPVEIDFNWRIHENCGGNQTRTEKARKAVRQVTAPIEWRSSGCKSFG